MGHLDEAFLEYAAAYDTAGLDMRSRATHDAWLAERSWPVLRLDGTQPVGDNVSRVLAALASAEGAAASGAGPAP
jgi:hypothetical protein